MRLTPVFVMTACLALFSACGGDDDSAGAADAATSADSPAALGWSNFADDFFTQFCHGCHGPGDLLRDYSQVGMVRSEMSKIRCGVSATTISGCTIAARMFPIGNGAKPTDAQRAMLVQWIDEGALD